MNNINELAYIKFKQGFQSLTETALGRYYWNITLNCDCDLQHCYDIIERYINDVCNDSNKLDDLKKIENISIGYYEKEAYEDMSSAIKKADEMMYEDKGNKKVGKK